MMVTVVTMNLEPGGGAPDIVTIVTTVTEAAFEP